MLKFTTSYFYIYLSLFVFGSSLIRIINLLYVSVKLRQLSFMVQLVDYIDLSPRFSKETVLLIWCGAKTERRLLNCSFHSFVKWNQHVFWVVILIDCQRQWCATAAPARSELTLIVSISTSFNSSIKSLSLKPNQPAVRCKLLHISMVPVSSKNRLLQFKGTVHQKLYLYTHPYHSKPAWLSSV